jgi:hypothetical protein
MDLLQSPRWWSLGLILVKGVPLLNIRRRRPNPAVAVQNLHYQVRLPDAEPRNILEKIVWHKDGRSRANAGEIAIASGLAARRVERSPGTEISSGLCVRGAHYSRADCRSERRHLPVGGSFERTLIRWRLPRPMPAMGPPVYRC